MKKFPCHLRQKSTYLGILNSQFSILNFLAVFLLLTALPAEAASNTSWDTTDQCKIILSLDAVSPYVQKVLDRADSGIQNAFTASIDTEFLLMPWAKNVEAAWAKRIDTQLRLTTQADDLNANSACLRFDMVSIECKMDQVRHQMNEQLDKGSFLAILKLTSLLEFLDNRYQQLSTGANDPEYADPAWNRIKNFDNATATFNEQMCPYSTDYGPPLQNGYGCDLDVLQSRKDFPPLGREYDALKVISDQLQEHQQNAAQFLTVQKQIDELFQTESQTPDPPKPRSHLTMNGCTWTGGICNNNPDTHCTADTDCGDGNVCTFPTKVCKENPSVRCDNDATCFPFGGATGSCTDHVDAHPANITLRGPFSLEKNHLQLLIDFFTQRVGQGNSREFKDSLKTVDEFSSDQTIERADRKNDAYFNAALRSSTRVLYSIWSRMQGAAEAVSFSFATDPSQEVASALSPLRASVGALARLTELKPADTEHPTLRSFIIKYTTFLLRSCVYRPCTESLEQILKITFADDCFPYTNGDFLKDNPDDPRSTKCADKAGLTIP